MKLDHPREINADKENSSLPVTVNVNNTGQEKSPWTLHDWNVTAAGMSYESSEKIGFFVSGQHSKPASVLFYAHIPIIPSFMVQNILLIFGNLYNELYNMKKW